jgi:chaperone modulatory protein CbpM
MNRMDEIATVCRVSSTEILTWIERGWVKPTVGDGDLRFDEVDVARIALIADLGRNLDLEDDTVGLVLSLLDQIHGLRGQLRRVADAIALQPADVRRAIVEAMQRP